MQEEVLGLSPNRDKKKKKKKMFHPKKEQKKTQQLPENHGKQKKKELINTVQYQIQSNRVEFICSKEGISSKPRGIDKMQEEVLGSSPNRDKNKKKKSSIQKRTEEDPAIT